jgi:hypothetical protein
MHSRTNETAVPERLRPLVKQLAALDSHDRDLVIAAARAAVLRPVAWEHLWDARGIVHLGGDAVADCAALYDDA